MKSVAPEYPVYFKEPIRWLRYHSHSRPHLFFPLAIGVTFLVGGIVLTPLRRKYLYPDHRPLPTGYPMPKGGRDLTLKGYDD